MWPSWAFCCHGRLLAWWASRRAWRGFSSASRNRRFLAVKKHQDSWTSEIEIHYLSIIMDCEKRCICGLWHLKRRDGSEDFRAIWDAARLYESVCWFFFSWYGCLWRHRFVYVCCFLLYQYSCNCCLKISVVKCCGEDITIVPRPCHYSVLYFYSLLILFRVSKREIWLAAKYLQDLTLRVLCLLWYDFNHWNVPLPLKLCRIDMHVLDCWF